VVVDDVEDIADSCTNYSHVVGTIAHTDLAQSLPLCWKLPGRWSPEPEPFAGIAGNMHCTVLHLDLFVDIDIVVDNKLRKLDRRRSKHPIAAALSYKQTSKSQSS
jgi:hypothetical protein